MRGARTLREVSREIGSRESEAIAQQQLGDVDREEGESARSEERLSAEECRLARLLLWRATGDREHLDDAKRLLDELLTHVSGEDRERMCQNLRVNREILAAWREEFGDGGEDDDPPSSESVTQAS